MISPTQKGPIIHVSSFCSKYEMFVMEVRSLCLRCALVFKFSFGRRTISGLDLTLSSFVGRDSSVGIATGYELDRPGIEYRWGRDFQHPSGPALRSIQPPVQWVLDNSRG